MPTVTIPGVELVRTGTWAASTGITTITEEDLDSMVAAARDPEVDDGPIKLGHTGALSKLGDSEPALGWVANVKRNGDRLVGDLVDVPERLAEVIRKAFRRRSAEIAWGLRTPGGRKYRAALTGLALLGVQPPAVKGLNDLLALYGTEARPAGANLAEVAERAGVVLFAEGDPSAGELRLISAMATNLAADVEAGRTTEAEADATMDRLYAAAGIPEATIPDAAPSPRHNDANSDPAASGGRRMPIDEARIRQLLSIEQDVDVEAELQRIIAQANAAGTGAQGQGDGANGGQGQGQQGTGQQGAAGTGQQGAGTGQANGQQGANGGGSGSTADAGAGNGTGQQGGSGGTPDLVGAGAGAGNGAPVANLSAATIEELNRAGVVLLAAGVAEELQTQAAAGAAARAELDQQARQQVINTALREGRISPAEVSNFAAADPKAGKAAGPWASFMQRPPAELQTFLSGLTPRFSVTELGHGADGDASNLGEDAWTAWEAETFPELAPPADAGAKA